MLNYDPQNIPLYILPEDIIWMIGKYVRDVDKIWLCKKYYYHNHYLLFENSTKREKVSIPLLKNIIRNDYEFILQQLLNIYGDLWSKYHSNKKYKYESMVFPSFMDMLMFWNRKYKSGRCENIMIEYLKYNGFRANRYKQNKQRNIRWTN